MRIVVLGYIVRGPLGGLCWHYLQYMIGFRQLGHEVLFLEDSDDYPGCYDPSINETGTDPSYGIEFIRNLFNKYDLQNNWAYYDQHCDQWFGLSKTRVAEFCKTADMVLNISNVNPLREWWMQIPTRILLDTDPAFTQIRHIEEERYRKIAEHHTHFFSFGENIGKPGCSIPDDGFKWKATRQPITLDLWEVADPNPSGYWTTVMQWDSYKPRQFNGTSFGMKSGSFSEYIDLPKKTEEKFQLALGAATAPIDKLKNAGWQLTDPLAVTLNSETFQRYLRESKGEFSVAKQGYVISNSGWFSERSAGYLASGKPVLLQETGFSDHIETGRGLFSFQSIEEVIESMAKINLDYSKHCADAREIAETFFNSDKVLAALLNELD